MDRDDAIGLFDSGVGGLTVLRALADKLPDEAFVYLGDTARVPYGTKSPETVGRYAAACARILQERGIKLLVAACNTASAYAIQHLRDTVDIPVIGVVEPGARAAALYTTTGRIGVIGTAGTLASGAYPRAIASYAPDAQVFGRACPLFVPLAEEGWTEGDVPERVARTYLAEILAADIDTLVLGCTHYPLLKGVLAAVAGPAIALIDSAEATADAVAETVDALDLRTRHTRIPRQRILVSDAPEQFIPIGERFLGASLRDVEWVDF